MSNTLVLFKYSKILRERQEKAESTVLLLHNNWTFTVLLLKISKKCCIFGYISYKKVGVLIFKLKTGLFKL